MRPFGEPIPRPIRLVIEEAARRWGAGLGGVA
jgi:hypothetical protein